MVSSVVVNNPFQQIYNICTRVYLAAQTFKEKVLESDYDAQKNVAPFLENRVLRKIVQTFTNDPRNDFSKWATNPQVISMMTQAKELMDSGRMTEDECEHLILQQLNDPSNPAHEDFKLKTKQQVRLTTEQLVPALNEQVSNYTLSYSTGKVTCKLLCNVLLTK
jgi:hypothetical protein